MIEQDFNYADSTIKEIINLFEIWVENLESKEDKTKASAAAMKTKDKKSLKKCKRKNSDSSVIKSSEESTEPRHPRKKNCILHGKCSHLPYAEIGASLQQ